MNTLHYITEPFSGFTLLNASVAVCLLLVHRHALCGSVDVIKGCVLVHWHLEAET